MKAVISRAMSSMILIIFIGLSLTLKGQTYLCELRKDALVNDHTYEFDICLQSTDDATLKLAAVQFGIYVNPAIIPEDGVLTATVVPGSSKMIKQQRPSNYNIVIEESKPNKTIKITGNFFPAGGKGTIISKKEKGTRFCRVRLSCSKPFVTGTNFGLAWSFDPPPSWPSKLIAYISYKPLNITAKGSYKVQLSVP